MAVARTREKGRGRRWERRRGAPRFCRAAPGCALRRFFDPQRSRKSLLEVRCECPGPPKMYIDVLGSWDTGGRRLTINSGFSYYPSTPDFAFRAAMPGRTRPHGICDALRARISPKRRVNILSGYHATDRTSDVKRTPLPARVPRAESMAETPRES